MLDWYKMRWYDDEGGDSGGGSDSGSDHSNHDNDSHDNHDDHEESHDDGGDSHDDDHEENHDDGGDNHDDNHEESHDYGGGEDYSASEPESSSAPAPEAIPEVPEPSPEASSIPAPEASFTPAAEVTPVPGATPDPVFTDPNTDISAMASSGAQHVELDKDAYTDPSQDIQDILTGTIQDMYRLDDITVPESNANPTVSPTPSVDPGVTIDISTGGLIDSSSTPDYSNIARDIMSGVYGDGDTRRAAIEALGLDYELAQAEVNKMYAESHKEANNAMGDAMSNFDKRHAVVEDDGSEIKFEDVEHDSDATDELNIGDGVESSETNRESESDEKDRTAMDNSADKGENQGQDDLDWENEDMEIKDPEDPEKPSPEPEDEPEIIIEPGDDNPDPEPHDDDNPDPQPTIEPEPEKEKSHKGNDEVIIETPRKDSPTPKVYIVEDTPGEIHVETQSPVIQTESVAKDVDVPTVEEDSPTHTAVRKDSKAPKNFEEELDSEVADSEIGSKDIVPPEHNLIQQLTNSLYVTGGGGTVAVDTLKGLGQFEYVLSQGVVVPGFEGDVTLYKNKENNYIGYKGDDGEFVGFTKGVDADGMPIKYEGEEVTEIVTKSFDADDYKGLVEETTYDYANLGEAMYENDVLVKDTDDTAFVKSVEEKLNAIYSGETRYQDSDANAKGVDEATRESMEEKSAELKKEYNDWYNGLDAEHKDMAYRASKKWVRDSHYMTKEEAENIVDNHDLDSIEAESAWSDHLGGQTYRSDKVIEGVSNEVFNNRDHFVKSLEMDGSYSDPGVEDALDWENIRTREELRRDYAEYKQDVEEKAIELGAKRNNDNPFLDSSTLVEHTIGETGSFSVTNGAVDNVAFENDNAMKERPEIALSDKLDGAAGYRVDPERVHSEAPDSTYGTDPLIPRDSDQQKAEDRAAKVDFVENDTRESQDQQVL